MRAVPQLLADGKRNLQPELAPALYVERALGQARAAVRYFRDVVPTEVADEALCARVAEAGAVAADAAAESPRFLRTFSPELTARGPLQRTGISGCIARKSSWLTTPPHCASAAESSTTASPRSYGARPGRSPGLMTARRSEWPQ
jgi:hypothetical protein